MIETFHRACPCGAIYRRTESMTAVREIASFECEVTVVAIGSIMMPAMVEYGYPKRFGVGGDRDIRCARHPGAALDHPGALRRFDQHLSSDSQEYESDAKLSQRRNRRVRNRLTWALFMNSKNYTRAVKYRQLALAEPDRATADFLHKIAHEAKRDVLCTVDWMHSEIPRTRPKPPNLS